MGARNELKAGSASLFCRSMPSLQQNVASFERYFTSSYFLLVSNGTDTTIESVPVLTLLIYTLGPNNRDKTLHRGMFANVVLLSVNCGHIFFQVSMVNERKERRLGASSLVLNQPQ